MNNFKVTKLDRRHTGYEVFSHYISYSVYGRKARTSWSIINAASVNEVNFLRARVWFWEKFGPSGELGKFGNMDYIVEESPLWAWQSEHNQLRIYVTEKALDFFMLTHSA